MNRQDFHAHRIQAERVSPVARVFKGHRNDFVLEENPKTVATAIRIGNPVSGRKALKAIYSTDGVAETVTDAKIISAQQFLDRKKGCLRRARLCRIRRWTQEALRDRGRGQGRSRCLHLRRERP